MNCKEFKHLMAFYIDGELDERILKLFMHHHDTCENCQLSYSKFYSVYSIIGNDKITESNPFFYTRIKAAIEREKKPVGRFSFLQSKRVFVQFATYLVIAFLAIFAGYYIANDKEYVDTEVLKVQTEEDLHQLFADSYQMNITADDVYIIKTNETGE